MLFSLPALFLNAFIAATILPAASEAMLWIIVANDPVMLWPAIAVASAGNTAGAVINWLLGRYLSQFSTRRWYPLTEKQQERAGAWFRRFGLWSLLFAWLPVVGDPLTVVAGVLRVRFPPFLFLVALGKTGRYVVIAILAS
ncbi:MAG: YqaA family protein [Alphaproteobacteria bacterium]